MLAASQKYLTIGEIQEAITNGSTTAKEIVYDYLQAAEQLNPELNAYTVLNPRALEEAERLDSLKPGDRGPLHGVPIAIKDGLETAGLVTAFGNIACKDYVPKEDATLVRLLKEAGAIIIGKTTMPDFAANFFSTSSLSGLSKNPFDLARDTGGSSSGSGSAVAANIAVATIGSDTGGSIRVPSSFNGLVGIRPSPGRISRHGMSPLLPLQDSPGPMARTVEDVARILDVIVGFDEKDPVTSRQVTWPPNSFTFLDTIKSPSLKGRRIGVVPDLFGEHVGIRKLMDEALKKFSKVGAVLIDVRIPDLDHYLASTFNYERSKSAIDSFLASREDLSSLKLDNLPYHKLCTLFDLIKQAPDDLLSSEDLFKALLEVPKFQQVITSVLAADNLDTIVYPTAQALPPKHEDLRSLKVTPLNFPTNTLIAAQLTFPAMSIPIGRTRDDLDDHNALELPVGIDILGLPLREDTLMALGAGMEAALKAA